VYNISRMWAAKPPERIGFFWEKISPT